MMLRKAKKWLRRARELVCVECALDVGHYLVRPTNVRCYLDMFTRKFYLGE